MSLFAGLSVGADCSTSVPACSLDASAHTLCSGGQERVCINHCVTPVGASHACAVDPCDADATYGVCQNGLTCMASSAGAAHGTCQNRMSGSYGCDPAATNGAFGADCPSGTYCVERTGGSTCGPQLAVQDNQDGLCVLGFPEGSDCDADFNESGGPFCARCEPGVQCVRLGSGMMGTCQRSCSSNTDCPCGSSTCVSGHCTPCIGDGYPCNPTPGLANSTCCNPTSNASITCHNTAERSASNDFGPGYRCCAENNASCTLDDQCCSGRCVSGTCSACRTAGQSASSQSQCCAGLVYDSGSGLCKNTCTVNSTPCDPTGGNSNIHDVSCHQGHATACNGMTGEVTTCVTNRPLLTESCNGIDDDCNGSIDDGIMNVGASCSTPTYIRRRSGALVAVSAFCTTGHVGTGHWECSPATRAGLLCVAYEGYDFCAQDSQASGVDPYGTSGMSCGISAGSPCSGSGCTANYHCVSGGGSSTCQLIGACTQAPSCWLATDRDTQVGSCP